MVIFPDQSLDSRFQYFEHITLNLPLIIGTTFTPFYEVTICIWPNNKGLIDLLIMLLGQINLPLLLGQSPLFMRSLFWWKLTKLNFFFRTKTPWVSHMRQTFCAWLQHESSLENTWSQSWKRKNRRSIWRITECNWLNTSIFNGLYVQSLVCCVYITGLYSIYKVLKYTLLTGHFFFASQSILRQRFNFWSKKSDH